MFMDSTFSEMVAVFMDDAPAKAKSPQIEKELHTERSGDSGIDSGAASGASSSKEPITPPSGGDSGSQDEVRRSPIPLWTQPSQQSSPTSATSKQSAKRRQSERRKQNNRNVCFAVVDYLTDTFLLEDDEPIAKKAVVNFADDVVAGAPRDLKPNHTSEIAYQMAIEDAEDAEEDEGRVVSPEEILSRRDDIEAIIRGTSRGNSEAGEDENEVDVLPGVLKKMMAMRICSNECLLVALQLLRHTCELAPTNATKNKESRSQSRVSSKSGGSSNGLSEAMSDATSHVDQSDLSSNENSLGSVAYSPVVSEPEPIDLAVLRPRFLSEPPAEPRSQPYKLRITNRNAATMLLAATMLAAKMYDDSMCHPRYFASLLNGLPMTHLTTVERALAGLLNHQVIISAADLRPILHGVALRVLRVLNDVSGNNQAAAATQAAVPLHEAALTATVAVFSNLNVDVSAMAIMLIVKGGSV